jgi:hypothetical protein
VSDDCAKINANTSTPFLVTRSPITYIHFVGHPISVLLYASWRQFRLAVPGVADDGHSIIRSSKALSGVSTRQTLGRLQYGLLRILSRAKVQAFTRRKRCLLLDAAGHYTDLLQDDASHLLPDDENYADYEAFSDQNPGPHTDDAEDIQLENEALQKVVANTARYVSISIRCAIAHPLSTC